MSSRDSGRRPSLLILNHSAQLGGGEIALLKSIEGLQESFEVSAAVPGPGPLVDALREADVEIYDQPVDAVSLGYAQLNRLGGAFRLGVGLIRYTLDLRSEVSAHKPDLVYANSLKSAVYAQILSLSVRRPWVWHLRDRLEVGYLHRGAIWILRGLAVVGPRQIIANSAGTASLLPKRARNKSVVIPSPIEVDRFSPTIPRPRPDGVVTFAVVARLTPVKGQHLVIEACAKAAQQCDVRLVLIGGDQTREGQQVEALKAFARELNIEDRVELTGHIDDVEAKLQSVDVLISYPSYPEPFGQAVIQAMAAGVPVIAANEGGPAEVIEHRVNGLLVVPRDPDALASAMCELATSPSERARLSSKATATAARFSADVIVPRLVSTLREASEGRS